MLNIRSFSTSVNCLCGKKHTLNTEKIFFGGGVINELYACVNNLLKAGHIAFFYDRNCIDDYDKDFILHLLNKDIYKITLKEVCFEKFNFENDNKKQCANYNLDEDVRLIIGVGGEGLNNFIKLTLQNKKIPFIFIPTKIGNGYLDGETFMKDEILAKISTPCRYLIADTNYISKYKTRDNIALGFSSSIAIRAYLSEYFFNLSKGENICPYLFEELKSQISASITFKFYEDEFVLIIFEALLMFSAVKEMTNTFYCDTASLYSRILLKHANLLENKYNNIISSYIILGYYRTRLKGGCLPLIFPMDRNKIIKKIYNDFNYNYQNDMEFFHDYGIDFVNFSEYIIDENASKLLNVVEDESYLDAKISQYKKILTDNGFLMKRLDIKNAITLFPLFAELCSCQTMLKILYAEGYLNKITT